MVQLPPRPASVETSANKPQNNPPRYTTYKYYNNYNTTTRSLNYILVEYTVFVQLRTWDTDYGTRLIVLDVVCIQNELEPWPTNFPYNNNDLRNETSTKVMYSMRETDYLLGEITKPSESRSSETTAEVNRGSYVGRLYWISMVTPVYVAVSTVYDTDSHSLLPRLSIRRSRSWFI